MASLNELSILSSIVYNPDGEPTAEKPLPPGWTVLSTSGVDAPGYFGVAYRNDATGEIVISNRGSQADISDWQNNASAFFGRVLTQFTAAKAFAEQVISAAPAAPITFTGHSLGGGLADMLAVHFANSSIPNATRAVAFDSIGVRDSLASLGAYDMSRDYSDRITNISAWFDPAQFVGIRVGADRRIAVSSIPYVPDVFEPVLAVLGAILLRGLGALGFVAYERSQHSMDNMLRTLSGLSPDQIRGIAPDLVLTLDGQLSGSLSGELASLQQAIATDITLQQRLASWSFEDEIQLSSETLAKEQDPGGAEPRTFTATNGGSNIVIGERSSDYLRGGTGADLIVGGSGPDWIEGGAGDDVLIGGDGTDTYYFKTGHGADYVIDSDGKGALIRDGKPIALGIRISATQWTFDGTTLTAAPNGRDLEIAFANNPSDSILVKNFDFSAAQANGFLGIKLID